MILCCTTWCATHAAGLRTGRLLMRMARWWGSERWRNRWPILMYFLTISRLLLWMAPARLAAECRAHFRSQQSDPNCVICWRKVFALWWWGYISSMGILPGWCKGLDCSWESQWEYGWMLTSFGLEWRVVQHEYKGSPSASSPAFLSPSQSSSVGVFVFFVKTASRAALTFSQKVFKEPSGVVLWILQMDIGSPPGSRSVVRSLFATHTNAHTPHCYHDGHSLNHGSPLCRKLLHYAAVLITIRGRKSYAAKAWARGATVSLYYVIVTSWCK